MNLFLSLSMYLYFNKKGDSMKNFIEKAFPGRTEERLSTYSQVLNELLKHMDKTSTSK